MAEVVTEGGSQVLDEYIDPDDNKDLPDHHDPVEPAKLSWKKLETSGTWRTRPDPSRASRRRFFLEPTTPGLQIWRL
jgi:hypothetical protein